MVPPERFELPTPALGRRRSNPLSYGGVVCDIVRLGAPLATPKR
jgi:hypothetical protein